VVNRYIGVFAAKVKTRWTLNPAQLLLLRKDLRSHYRSLIRRKLVYQDDPTFRYLQAAGFLKRGWISDEPVRKTIAVKCSIHSLDTHSSYKHAFMLALMSEVLCAANVKFGPELYCADPKEDADVLGGVIERIETMASDLTRTATLVRGHASVILGDARECSALVRRKGRTRFAAVICSPPYPNEHDYTRNARLELALLEAVTSIATLRSIKQMMIRSHTKGIYASDNDGALVARIHEVKRIASALERKVAKSSHGFARYYPAVIREYFGGMRRHLVSVRRVLRKDAMCAYVVGDQACYLKMFVPTARILGQIAERVGFSVVEIRRWRGRRPTSGGRAIDENVLILRKRAS